jgi:hypothetical protein
VHGPVDVCEGSVDRARAAAEMLRYLAQLEPDDDIDHRGTKFTEHLLRILLQALSDPITKQARLHNAQFDEATFSCPPTSVERGSWAG